MMEQTPVYEIKMVPEAWPKPKLGMCSVKVSELLTKKTQELKIGSAGVCDDVKNRLNGILNSIRLKKRASTTKMHLYESDGNTSLQLDQRQDITIAGGNDAQYIRECSKLVCGISNLYLQMGCYPNAFPPKPVEKPQEDAQPVAQE